MLNRCCITVFNICATILLKYVVPLSIHFTSNFQKAIVLTRAVDVCRKVHLKNSHNQTEHASAQILIQILSRTFKLCILTIIFENNSVTRQNIGRINSPLDSKVRGHLGKNVFHSLKFNHRIFFEEIPSTIIRKLNTIEL